MFTRTTTALLDGLVDPANEEIWRAFDDRYRPILVAFGYRLGLAPEDAADAAQETLTRFVRSFRAGKYDRTRGRLRSWIVGIARHCIVDLQQAAGDRRERRGLSAVAEVPDDAEIAEVWDDECEREILRKGMAELRQETKTDPRTIRAFEMLAFDGRRPAQVAQELSITTNDVYLAKHRCLKRLRAIIDGLHELYEVG